MKTEFQIGNWRLEQKEERVTVFLKWFLGELENDLPGTWFATQIGCPATFKSEAEANYWFEEAKKFLKNSC